MKRVILTLLVFSVAGLLRADTIANVFSVNPKGRMVPANAYADNMAIKAVTPSSSTATLVWAANATRRGLIIRNSTGFGSSVYLSTHAATSTTGLYPIADGSEFSDSDAPYVGAIYVLGAPSISSTSVITVEKW